MTTYSPLIVGVFQKESDAQHAITTLRNAGFDRNQIGLALREGGVVSSNLVDNLLKLGVPQDRAGYYDNEYRAGRAVVSVSASGREQEVMDILRRYGAYGVSATTGTMAATTPGTQQTYTGPAKPSEQSRQHSDLSEGEQRAMRLREEQLEAEKQRVQTGEVRLEKEVVTEVKTINVPVSHEEVYIERRPVAEGQISDTPIGQGETIRVPITEEQVLITKQTVVTGEVTIGKQDIEENVQYTDTVKREEARLEREGRSRIHTNEDINAPVDEKTRTRSDEEPRRRTGGSNV